MNITDLRVLHRRIREAQLPGYSLTYNEGANEFSLVLYGHNGEQAECGDHSWDITVEWAQEQLTKWGA
jgi:hypothetical protein